jgi:hypothetical protein
VSVLEETGFEFALHVQQHDGVGTIDVRGHLGAAHVELFAEAMTLVDAPALVVSLADCESCGPLGLRALAAEYARRGHAMSVVASVHEDTRGALADACPGCGLLVAPSAAAARAAANARLAVD